MKSFDADYFFQHVLTVSNLKRAGVVKKKVGGQELINTDVPSFIKVLFSISPQELHRVYGALKGKSERVPGWLAFWDKVLYACFMSPLISNKDLWRLVEWVYENEKVLPEPWYVHELFAACRPFTARMRIRRERERSFGQELCEVLKRTTSITVVDLIAYVMMRCALWQRSENEKSQSLREIGEIVWVYVRAANVISLCGMDLTTNARKLNRAKRHLLQQYPWW